MEWEFAILDMLQEMHHPVLTKIMAFVTMLGEAGWFWILLGVILLCTKRFRKCGVAVLLALVLDFLLANVILKPLVARPRPCWINDTVELLVRVIPSPPDIPWLLLRRQGLCFSQRKNWEFVVWYWLSLWEFPDCIFTYIFPQMFWPVWYLACSADLQGYF